MRLTRKKAIELCIELWTKLAKTGSKYKSRAIRWTDYITRKEANESEYCWLCIYNNRKARKPQSTSECSFACPYYQVYDFYARRTDTPYNKWYSANTRSDRKKYAKLFLEQIKSIAKE